MIGTRIAVLAAAFALAGCASAGVATVPRFDGNVPACEVLVPDRDLLLGVALSGGGSRAALFGSAGLEALAGIRTADGTSLIDRIAHVSSVSGGSLAASYYALKKPGRDVKVLGADGALTPEYRAFFDQYRTDLSQDFESTLIWRQLLSFRWLNPALAAKTLSEILIERLYGRARLQDLAARERAGDSPGLIVNATLYNNGRRLVGTVLPWQAFDYDFFADLERTLRERGRPIEPTPYIHERFKLLRPMTFTEIRADPCPIPIAGLATASASFPPLVGPITMQVGGEKTYWHAGDGGLYENSGIESLIFLYLKQLQAKRAKRALIIAFDSSFPFAVGERRLASRSLPFTILTFDFSRIPSIMEERASTYQALFFRSLQLEGVIPDTRTINVVALRHTDAKWAADLGDLPPACQGERETLKAPDDVRERLAEIPTRLVIASECDRQLLATAAAKLVAQYRSQILEFIDRPY